MTERKVHFMNGMFLVGTKEEIMDEAIERQAKDRKKLSQPHSVSGSRRDHSHDVDSALTDHVPRRGKGRVRPASKKEMRVSAMRDAGIKQEEVVKEVAPPGWGHTKAEKEKTDPSKPKSKIGGTIAAMKRAQERGDIPKKLNIFALAYSMKNKGANPHYIPGTKEKYKKYQEEDAQYGYDKKGRSLNPKDIKKRSKKSVIPSRDDHDNKPAIEDWVSNHSMNATESLSVKDSKKLDKASSLSQSDNPKDWMRSSARWTEVSVKDLKKQRKKGTVGVGKSMREGRSWKEWKQAARDAVRKKTPKHDYGKDAGAEAARRLRRRDHEKVNFLDPED